MFEHGPNLNSAFAVHFEDIREVIVMGNHLRDDNLTIEFDEQVLSSRIYSFIDCEIHVWIRHRDDRIRRARVSCEMAHFQ